MKVSPVQLLQSTIEKLSIEANDAYNGEDPKSLGEDLELQVKEICEPFAEFWTDQAPPREGVEERTFMVRLAIRTDPDVTEVGPYAFELVFSGVVACMPPKANQFTPMQAARQFGFAMIYGAMREQFLTVTSRMPHGPRLLPTVSFMEPDAPPAKVPNDGPSDSQPAKIERRKSVSGQPARKNRKLK